MERWLPGAGLGVERLLLSGYRVSVWEDKAPGMGGADGKHTVKGFNATEVCA